VAFLLLLVGVVWGSLIRLDTAPGGQIDKVEHFVAYASLTALGFAAINRRSRLLLTALGALGAGVEVLQAILPTGRTGSVWDLVANVAGAFTIWLIWTLVVRLRRPLPPGANDDDGILP
jgi:VanZ family protein